MILPDLISDVPMLVGLVPSVSVNASWRDVFQSTDGRRLRARNAGHRAASDGHALHVTSLRVIVVNRVVLGRAIVPHSKRLRFPVQAVLILRYQGLVEQQVE